MMSFEIRPLTKPLFVWRIKSSWAIDLLIKNNKKMAVKIFRCIFQCVLK